MKKAFTMIELIFVIVILGILAAVALPKFLGVSKQAHEANLKSFVGTLNRTVGPTLWSKSIAEGKNGDISKLETTEGAAFLKKYVDLPKEIDENKIDLTKCDDPNKYKIVIDADKDVAGGYYFIACKDGNANQSPSFILYKQTKPTDAQATLGDYNTTSIDANPAKYGDDNNGDKEEGTLLK